MKFKILYKAKTPKNCNYWKLLVEIANGIWEEVTYFGNTKPKAISSLSVYKDMWVAKIQPPHFKR